MGVIEQAQAWLADDPDPVTRAELARLLDRWPETADDLAERFTGRLVFGTAGLRGPVRAGPNGMNLAVVRATAAGLMSWLADRGAVGPVVVGYDARHGSRQFAQETARVATGAGRPALVLPRPLPTPVLAHTVLAQAAAAGVMVTASHNPPADNGYKVYLGTQLGGPTGAGAQLVSPADRQVEAAIQAVGPLSQVPLGPAGELLGEDVVTSYLDQAAQVVTSATPREVAVAYSPLHGVGREVLTAAMVRAGFPPPLVVAEQSEPDPDFSTVPFPNPEEPGVMDRLSALAKRSGAQLAIAHDPDADRCAVTIPTGADWRTLHGDEVGVLLADHLMRHGVTGRYATTIVSSSLLRAMCEARGQPYSETLTGFKWIVRAGADLVYGYEEALGYCVAPRLVRDKDGITAALLICELAATLHAAGQTLADRLDELAAEFGVHLTDQLAVRLGRPEQVTALMTRVRGAPPAALGDEPVTAVTDLLPAADVLILRTATGRVVLRPSGTEPKLKVYLELVTPVVGADRLAARAHAGQRLDRVKGELRNLLAEVDQF